MRIKNIFAPIILLWLSVGMAQAGTIDSVKERGTLNCGVSTGLAGFSIPDEKGHWTGFDVDYCRAVAAAIFDDPTRVKFVPLGSKERFSALQSGEIDVLIRNTSWTMNRDTALGLVFTGTTYHDGQGFMVNAKNLPDIDSIDQLSGASICVQSGTSTELSLADYFKTHGLEYTPVVFEKFTEVNAAYDAGRCDAYTTDQTTLYSVRLQLSAPQDNKILDQIISKEPFSPAVRQNDPQWAKLIKWVNYALINAEELGITKANVEEMKNSQNPDVKRLLGVEKGVDFGKDLGLNKDWVVQIISSVGNYGEIFDANLGEHSQIKIKRGINNLWTKGGLMYGIPVR